MKISLQSKFQPNRTSGYRVIAIFFKVWPKFGPSSGTLGPIPKNFLRCNLPYCVGSVSKFQPPGFKTVEVVWQGRTFLASILYTRKMSRDFPGFFSCFPGFPMLSRDFYCFPAGFEFFWRRNVPPTPHTQNVEVLVISVYTAYGPIHQICLSVLSNHYFESRWL